MVRILVAINLVLFAASVISGQSSKLSLGYIKRTESESGCSFFRNISDEQNDRPIFVSLSDESAYINLNGRTLKLRPVAASKEKRHEHVGDRSWKTYAARGVRVRIDLVVSGVCPPNDEQCEATHYNAIFTVRCGHNESWSTPPAYVVLNMVPNKSLDASGGSVFRIVTGPAMLE